MRLGSYKRKHTSDTCRSTVTCSEVEVDVIEKKEAVTTAALSSLKDWPAVIQYGKKWLASNSMSNINAVWSTNALIIDVRTPSEFAVAHIEGAINIPLSRLTKRIDAFINDREQQIVLYSRSGKRSAQAIDLLRLSGQYKVINGTSLGTVSRRTGKPIVPIHRQLGHSR